MKRSTINKLKNADPIRYRRWFSEGKKDGMCSRCRQLKNIPKVYREAYHEGHTYGALTRGAA